MARSNRLLGQAQTIPIYAHNEESYIRDDYSCRRLLIILILVLKLRNCGAPNGQWPAFTFINMHNLLKAK